MRNEHFGKQHGLAVGVPLVVLAAVLSVALGRALQAAPGQAPGSSMKTTSKTGISYRPIEDPGPPALVDALRVRRPGGKLLNLDRMLLNSPPFAQGWNAMFAAIRGDLSLPPKLRELVILSIAVLNRADYEWIQHEKEFIAVGGRADQLNALRGPRTALADVRRFDEVERATLALTYEMTRDVVVTEATMRRVRALLPNKQVVELVGTIAGYNMVSRFLVATGVEAE